MEKIKCIETDDGIVVSSKEIHGYLGIKSQYSDWMRRRGMYKYPAIPEDPLDVHIPKSAALDFMLKEFTTVSDVLRGMFIDGRIEEIEALFEVCSE